MSDTRPEICQGCGWPFHPSTHMEDEDCDGQPLSPPTDVAVSVETFDPGNPHKMFSIDWYVWLEQRGWMPQCFGDMPGDHVLTRAVVVRPGVYRCSTCGDEWPTYAERDRRRRET